MWHNIIIFVLFTIVTATNRLSDEILPVHYNLSMAYHIDAMEEVHYFGLVRIQLSARDTTNKIELHVNNPHMVIDAVIVSHFNGSDIHLVSIEGAKTSQILRLKLSQFLMKDHNYTLTIPYQGKLVPSLSGVFKGAYVDEKTKEKEYVIYSHFEPIGARSAFPCFDEPNMKATFTINLAHNLSYNALSNMRIEKMTEYELMAPYWTWDKIETKIGNKSSQNYTWVWSTFETSKPMSTYLVAWVISKFTNVADEVEGVAVNLWARRSHVAEGTYALSVATKLLPFFANVFKIPFPLSKIDIVAIPDFKPLAMENWGLVVFHESMIILETKEPTLVEKDQVIELIAHELAHQWFGDLVTMNWWPDTWVNEGFTTLMVYLAKDYLDPTGNTYDTYIALGMRKMLEIDELRYSHQVSTEINDPTAITQMFDSLSYLKSALIINMMRHFLGNEIFTKGIHRYFTRYSFKNVTQDQLWNELTGAANGTSVLPQNVTIKEIMNSWSSHPGIPLLTVNRDYNSNSVYLNCKQFKVLPNETTSENVWWIPIVILSQLNSGTFTKAVAWLGPKSALRQSTVRVNSTTTDAGWMLFNMDMIAPMRVNYDKRNWDLLTNTLLDEERFTSIPVLSRTQLLSDSFTLAKVSSISYITPLRMVMYIQHETKYAPLETGLKNLWDIRWRMLRDTDYKEYLNFMRKLLTPIYEQPQDARTRVLAIDYACKAHLQACEDMAASSFNSWFTSKYPDRDNPIDLVLRPVIYCAAIRDGGVRYWDFLNKRRLNAVSVTETDNIIRALACTEDSRLLSRYLNMTLEKNSTIPEQDFLTVLREILRSPVGYKLAHDFFLERTNEVVDSFQSHGVMILGDIANDLVAWYNSDKELKTFQEWTKRHPQIVEFNKPRVQEAIDFANLNLRTYESSKDIIEILRSQRFVKKIEKRKLDMQNTGVTIYSSTSSHILKIICIQSLFFY